MAAQIGADDLDFAAVDRTLLREISGLEPEPSGVHVLLEKFLTILGRRPAHLRPGLRLKKRWDADAVRSLGGRRELAVAIRSEVNAIVGAAGEPQLPAASAKR
jgi:hypothetical protein